MADIENKYFVCSIEDTKKYGIISAAILGRIKYWCDYNRDNKVKDRFYHGNWWSGFMSSKDFSLQLGLSVRTIEKHLSILIKSGIITKGVFNKKKYDRTGWYRVNPFTPIEESIYSNRVNGNTLKGEMELLQKGTPIPVNLSINQTDSLTAKLSNNPKDFVQLTRKQIDNLSEEQQTQYWKNYNQFYGKPVDK